ncbi:hypothetical protein G5B40_09020 [Pikeienuella piscinae]|uniref:Uncharacterized protein n=1 Tax=Pikeienuella piscinae TaxID=2748098 RepID=A0A7L5C0B4_9RHOB|nr:hypothetical protein [Pikeienuella piscinae]QIE55584.1 hypothetical protein G5B40_09020 [Pikeienuella piscinae]
MLTKILIFVAVLIGVFVVARMGASSAIKPNLRSKKKASKLKDAEDLVPCPVCGAWSARGEGCPCGGAPTP